MAAPQSRGCFAMAEEDDGTPAPDVGDAPLPLGAELQDDLAVNYFRRE